MPLIVKTTSPIPSMKCGVAEVYDEAARPTGRLLDVLNRSAATIGDRKWAVIEPEKYGWTFVSWEV